MAKLVNPHPSGPQKKGTVLEVYNSSPLMTELLMQPNKKTSHRKQEPTMAEQTEVGVLSDLKAFERRLTEVIDKLQPAARGWRMLLIVISILTAVGAWAWLWDPRTSQVTFMQSLLYHPVFAISCFTLLLLFLFGIHKRVVAPSIIASRCRFVLGEYNMSCDDTGKLILKPRPST